MLLSRSCKASAASLKACSAAQESSPSPAVNHASSGSPTAQFALDFEQFTSANAFQRQTFLQTLSLDYSLVLPSVCTRLGL